MKYTIVRGDTLNSIARNFKLPFGGIRLFEINRQNLRSSNPELIFPGEIIDIPSQVIPTRNVRNENPFPLLQSADPDQLVLFINEQFLSFWDAFSFSSDIENIADSFSLSAAPQDRVLNIEENTLCYFSYGQNPILSGYVETIETQIDKNTFIVTLNGRTIGSDIIDSVPLTNQSIYRNSKIENIIRNLLNPFTLDIEVATDTGDPISLFKIESGTSIFEALKKELRKKSLLLKDTPFRNLRLFRLGENRIDQTIREGSDNFISARVVSDFKNIFSTYQVTGQARNMRNVSGIYTDPEITRLRKKIVNAEEQVNSREAQQRARWEASLAQSEIRIVEVKLSGLRTFENQFWQVGRLINVELPTLNIENEMLIKSLSLQYAKTNVEISLSLIDPGVYNI